MNMLRVWVAVLAVGTFAMIGTTTGLAQDKKDSHPEVGPHKGALAEWGEEEYHVEITFNHKEKQVIVYMLDGSAKKAKPIESKEIVLTLKQKPAVTVKLKAAPDKGDPTGFSSRFFATHEAFAKHQDFEGTVSGKVGTKPYSGDFKAKHTHDK
jgi:hypothetical protein